VPPRQRRRQLGLARGARLLRVGDPGRSHGDPEGDEDVSTTHYFGDAVYTYSLKQGIEDGFLAPYKVVRIDLDKDLAGWRPEKGKVDKLGQEIEDRIYNQRDFDRTLVLEKRTELVAKKVTEFLAATTGTTRRSSSARTSTTPSGCARRS
jgi:type I site-specific restriction endonuclease